MKLVCFLTILMTTLFTHHSALAGDENRIVRMAKLQIDPAHLEAYQAALREEIETSVRVEPGVLSLSAVAEKDHPESITILEVYANQEAYEAHLRAPHFVTYKASTQTMVKSLDLVETIPVALAAKVTSPAFSSQTGS